MHTLRITPPVMFIVASLLLVLLTPATAQAAAPYEASEQQFLKLMNAARRSEGRGALTAAPDVATVARNWSKRMARDGDLRHNPDVDSQLTVEWTRWGENVGWASNGSGASLSSVVKRLHNGFMESRGHRANILGDFNQVGVGVAVERDGTMWATMVFVKVEGSAPSSEGPTDIDHSTHRRAIERAWRRGLIGPCEGRRFCPRRKVSRTETADVFGRMLDLEATAGRHFTDVPGTSVINTLVGEGVVSGCSAHRVCPRRNLTRAQLASLLVRALPDLGPDDRERFVDLPAGYVHAGAINALAGAGVTEGCRPARFCPTATVTREQLASFTVRALDLM